MKTMKTIVLFAAVFAAFALRADPDAAYTENATVSDPLVLAGEYIIDSGVVDLQNGASHKVKELRIDGDSLPPGTYGGADAPEGVNKTYAAHFSGNGTMHVSGGFMLIVK